MIEEGREVAVRVSQKVRADLMREMAYTGASGALTVCKYNFIETLSTFSRQNGWRIAQVSLKPRNPALAAPDAWEQKVLVDFDRRVAGGEKGEGLEHAEIVIEPMGRYFRYMKALPMEDVCLGCHGRQESLSTAVKRRLAVEYPFDKATGYEVGQVRGAVTIKRPL